MNANITFLLGKFSSSCLHSGATCGICRILAETNSVTCLLHGYQHDAPNLTTGRWQILLCHYIP